MTDVFRSRAERAQLREDDAGVFVVHAAGRLVREHERRLVEHGAAVGDALLLAARELSRIVPAPMSDAEARHQPARRPRERRARSRPRYRAASRTLSSAVIPETSRKDWNT